MCVGLVMAGCGRWSDANSQKQPTGQRLWPGTISYRQGLGDNSAKNEQIAKEQEFSATVQLERSQPGEGHWISLSPHPFNSPPKPLNKMA